MSTTARIVQNALINAAADGENFADEIAAIAGDDEVTVESVQSFDNAGLLTSHAGVVLNLTDGSEYQLTVKCSRLPRHVDAALSNAGL